MPVFPNDMIVKMQEVLSQMVQTYCGKTMLTLTESELVQTFIRPDHVPFLKEAQEIVGVFGANTRFEFPLPINDMDIRLETVVASGEPLLLPKYVRGGLQPSAPEAVRDKIEAWAKDRLRVGLAAGDAHVALRKLNGTCSNAKAFCTMFPALTTLMSRVPADEKRSRKKREAEPFPFVERARRIMDTKSMGELPQMQREDRERIYTASTVVNAITLVEGADTPKCPKNGALIYLKTIYTGPGGGLFGGSQSYL